MKKTLSIILAILMIVTTVPMAFAADDAFVASLTATDGTITYYATADEAFTAAEAAKSGTVTILEDAEILTGHMLASYSEIDLVVTSGKTLTLKKYLYVNGDVSGGGTIGSIGGWSFSTYGSSTFRECTVNCTMSNSGIIISGTFNGNVTNLTGTINGGTFNGNVSNQKIVNGGTFNSHFDNCSSSSHRGTINNTTVGAFQLGDGFTINNSLTETALNGSQYTVTGTINCTAHIYQDDANDCLLCEESHTHDIVKVEYKAATCSTGGWEAYEYCTGCSYTTVKYIPYDPHNHSAQIIQVDAKTPTCYETGWEKYEYCPDCKYTTKVEIPSLSHEGTLVTLGAKAPTCTEIGWEKYEYCTACDYEYFREKKEALNHKYTLVKVGAKAPTCTETGWDAYEYCTACNYTTKVEIPVDPDAHDWSNKDGKCIVCGAECAHENYHYQERIRPVQNADGTWSKGTVKAICSTCGCVTSEKEVERDHEGYVAFEESVAKVEALLNREDLIDGPKNDYTRALNNLKKDAYSLVYMDDEEAMMRIKAIADSYISEVEAGLADGTMKKADWTYMTALFEEINAIIDNDYHNIISSMNSYYLGPQGYYNGCSNSPTFTQASYNGNIHFEKQLETLLAGLKDGTALKVDGLEEIVNINDKLNNELAEKYGEEALAEIAEKLDEKFADKFDELYERAEALTGSVAENKDALAEIEAEMEAIFAEAENCLNGTHNGLKFEVTEEAKCGENAIESATCTLCGETVTREVENSALTHSFTKYEETEAPKCGVEGKEVAYCDNGCGATDEKAIEALRHSFTKYEVTEEAKCGIEGKKVAACDNGCGATDEKAIEALGHTFSNYIYNEDATCTADGTKTAACDNGCGETDTVTAEDTMLKHADENGDDICDDCETEIVKTCPDCGRPVHEGTINQFICLILNFIRLIVSFFKSV